MGVDITYGELLFELSELLFCYLQNHKMKPLKTVGGLMRQAVQHSERRNLLAYATFNFATKTHHFLQFFLNISTNANLSIL